VTMTIELAKKHFADIKKEEEKTLLFYDYYVYLDPRRAQPTEQRLNKIEDKAKILPQYP